MWARCRKDAQQKSLILKGRVRSVDARVHRDFLFFLLEIKNVKATTTEMFSGLGGV